MAIMRPLHKMDHAKDPADEIRQAVGDISELELTGVQVLVGTYIRPKKTAGGIILTDRIRDEDLYQGKVGLVLKVADAGFVDDDNVKFNGFKAKPGDWIFYYVQDSHSLSVNGYHCRVLEDAHIRGRVPNPDMVM